MFVQIDPLSRGMKNEDYIFAIKFLSDDYNLKDFTYKWTLNEMSDAAIYLNGRTETMVKIKNDAVKKGSNMIQIDFTDKSGNSYVKTSEFKRSAPPTGGSCTVNPPKGFSLITNYKFE
jgi:hypothetical protein